MLLPCNVWHGLLSFSLHLPLLLSKVIDKVGTYYEFGWDGMVPRLDEVDAEDIRVNLKVQTRLENCRGASAVQTPLFSSGFLCSTLEIRKTDKLKQGEGRDSTAKGINRDLRPKEEMTRQRLREVRVILI